MPSAAWMITQLLGSSSTGASSEFKIWKWVLLIIALFESKAYMCSYYTFFQMEAFNEMREVGLHKEDNMTEKMEEFSDIQYVCLDMYVLDIFQILSLHETISFFFQM